MKDFFISYNKADRSWAEWIAWQLEEAGYSVVIQAWDFRPGSDFVLEMDRATREAERTIAVLSDDYLNAKFTRREWAAAFAKDPEGDRHTLIPVLVGECKVEGLLNQIVHIKLVDLDEPMALQALLEGVKSRRGKPISAPGFPMMKTQPRLMVNRPHYPGLPPVWNVPHRRNPNFTGREELLGKLQEALMSRQPAALTQAIHGLGGVGKTQLATEYAYRHAGEYDVVWWVRAEEVATLAADYAGLAGKLGLSEANAREQEVIVEAVRDWLEREQDWLLIFDNANKQEELIEYLPRIVNGHVLITSRNPNWGESASTIRVAVFDLLEAIEFLMLRTKQQDKEDARKLSEELGCLPLALAQAGAYMETTQVTITKYLSLFLSRRKELWAEEKGPLDYKKTVSATMSLAIERVVAESPDGVDLLKLCAFLGPDDIPSSLLSEGEQYLPARLGGIVGDELKMNKAIGALRLYSLIEVDIEKDSLSVHRLVQAVVRDGLEESESKIWAEAAVDVVDKGFLYDSDNVRTWAECARLLSHALSATGHIELLEVATESAGRLLNQVGNYLGGRAQYVEAKNALERSLLIIRKVYGVGHFNFTSTLNSLGVVLKDLGDLEGAKAHYEQALAIDEKTFGHDHPKVAISVSNLCAVLLDLRDLEGARAYCKRALAIDEKTFGHDHPTVAGDVNNLGMVLKGLRDLEGAKAHLERALSIYEKAFGPDHPKVATCANNLGMVLKSLGDLEGAKAHYERALAIDETAFGPDHPDVAIDVNNLGGVLWDLGDLEGAKAHYERALAIDETAFGPDHPTIAIRVNNLGSLLQELGDLEGAKAHLERAFQLFRQFLGEAHPDTVTVRRNLGVVMDLLARKG
ncbi:MAG TPA: FxSxx-COOH system tetratricopeptide repeat protein [Chloroflexia bacterium]|jgi:tetratricopeptide (TPR) repeat protein